MTEQCKDRICNQQVVGSSPTSGSFIVNESGNAATRSEILLCTCGAIGGINLFERIIERAAREPGRGIP